MQIGPYVLISELACGGMAQLWLAHRVWPDGRRRPCVVKLPRLNAVTDEAVLWQFVEEGRLSIQLRHDNIVRVFDMGTHEGLPFLVMDYIPGADLAQLTRALSRLGIAWEVEDAIHVVREIAQGLLYAHDLDLLGVHQQIVHRDMATKNVMVDGNGAVLLTDFGVATSIGTQTSRVHIKGTLAFMAPEHLLAQAIPASDVFGLGGIFWELLAGRPFRGGLEGQALRSVVIAGTVEPVGRELPPHVQRVLEGLLHPDASRRMSLHDLLAAFEDSPHRRRALKRMVSVNFGPASRRTGHSQIHFASSKELDDTLAVAKIAGVSVAEGKGRLPAGQPNPLPADFTPVDIGDTSRVGPTAVPAALDDDVEPPAATVRISAAIAMGSIRMAVPDVAQARGATTILPAPGTVRVERGPLVAEPGAPVRVETQRSLPMHPMAASSAEAARWDTPSDASSTPCVAVRPEPIRRPVARASEQRRVLSVVVVAIMVILGLGNFAWLMVHDPAPLEQRDDDVTQGPAVASVGERPIAAKAIPESPAPELQVAVEREASGDARAEPRPGISRESPEEPTPAFTEPDPPPTPVSLPAAKPKRRSPKPAATLDVTVRRGLMVDFAEFKVGAGKAREVPATGSLTLRVAPGTYTLRSRTKPDGPWDEIRYTFFSNMRYAGHVERSGPRMMAVQGAK